MKAPASGANGIPEMIGDIPGSLFVSGNAGTIKTASGPLHYHFAEDRAWLNYGPQTDPSNGEYHDFPHFSAVVDRYSGRTCLTFSVRSTLDITPIRESFGLKLGERHRGIRAAELLGASIVYAESIHGTLGYLRGSWEEGDSVNFATYQEVMASATDLPIKQRQKKAAFATWTGQQALKHQFSSVSVSEEGVGLRTVYAYFRRPLLYGIARALRGA